MKRLYLVLFILTLTAGTVFGQTSPFEGIWKGSLTQDYLKYYYTLTFEGNLVEFEEVTQVTYCYYLGTFTYSNDRIVFHFTYYEEESDSYEDFSHVNIKSTHIFKLSGSTLQISLNGIEQKEYETDKTMIIYKKSTN